MSTIYDYVIQQLDASKGSWHKVSHATGISQRTIEKWARKEIANPRIKQFETLYRYFQSREIKKR
jgi:DNA-binding transcriptional MerR regulator